MACELNTLHSMATHISCCVSLPNVQEMMFGWLGGIVKVILADAPISDQALGLCAKKQPLQWEAHPLSETTTATKMGASTESVHDHLQSTRLRGVNIPCIEFEVVQHYRRAPCSLFIIWMLRSLQPSMHGEDFGWITMKWNQNDCGTCKRAKCSNQKRHSNQGQRSIDHCLTHETCE